MSQTENTPPSFGWAVSMSAIAERASALSLQAGRQLADDLEVAARERGLEAGGAVVGRGDARRRAQDPDLVGRQLAGLRLLDHPVGRDLAGRLVVRAHEGDLVVHLGDVLVHDYETWTTTLERLARAHGLRGTRLLDVACGTGKSFLPFLDRGYEVTACDISPAMAERAAAKAGDRARVEVHDMRALPGLGAFDLVCCLDDAVNYVLSAEELEATFAGLARNLAPGGVVVFDANSLARLPDVLRVDDRARRRRARAGVGGSRARPTSQRRPRAGDARGICRREDGTWWRERSAHLQRHHPRETVERALRRAGLQAAAVYGMRLDGSTTDAFDDLDNSKAVYVACAAPTATAATPASLRAGST